MDVRKQRIPARGLKRSRVVVEAATSSGQKTTNPRKGIETRLGVVAAHGLVDCQKTTNPRKGIETVIRLACAAVRIGNSQKTTNPRKGIETLIIV